MAEKLIDDFQILALQNEASVAGDWAMHQICERALDGDDAERARCLEVIEAAKAMEG